MDEPVQRQLSLTWGVKPLIMPYVQSTDEMIEGSVAVAKEAGLIHDGEIAVVTAGVPAGIAGTTNMIKVHLVGSSLISGAGVGNENVKGVLCVCRTLEDVKQKFRPGMILVVPPHQQRDAPLHPGRHRRHHGGERHGQPRCRGGVEPEQGRHCGGPLAPPAPCRMG